MTSLSVNSLLFPQKNRETVTSIDIYCLTAEKNPRVNLIADKVISMKGSVMFISLRRLCVS